MTLMLSVVLRLETQFTSAASMNAARVMLMQKCELAACSHV